MSSNSPAVRKLKREYGRLEAEPVHKGISVRPLESNFLHAHFLLSGEVFHDTPYEGGVYHGVLQFPKEYPFKPPSIIMRTPSGRFNPNNKICFSWYFLITRLTNFNALWSTVVTEEQSTI